MLWLLIAEAVVYVGKGTGDRFTVQISHTIAALKGESNVPIDEALGENVVDALKKLVHYGRVIGFARLTVSLTSPEAYWREANLIKAIGRGLLKNQVYGRFDLGHIGVYPHRVGLFELVTLLRRIVRKDPSIALVSVAMAAPPELLFTDGKKNIPRNFRRKIIFSHVLISQNLLLDDRAFRYLDVAKKGLADYVTMRAPVPAVVQGHMERYKFIDSNDIKQARLFKSIQLSFLCFYH